MGVPGQYFTPPEAARIMANLPEIPSDVTELNILDPGAGRGILAYELVKRLIEEVPGAKLSVTLIENDPKLNDDLNEMKFRLESLGVKVAVIIEDFVDWAIWTKEVFDLIILNPPYYKLAVRSPAYKQLKKFGILVPNIYAAFMALGQRLLKKNGQQISITPRSWMNGTYFKSFRKSFICDMGIESIHTFESRSKVFGEAGVLQESVIICARRAATPPKVAIYTSVDHTDEPKVRIVDQSQVATGDFIFIPATEKDGNAVQWMQRATCSLEELGLQVSTGRVVDFRCKEYLAQEAGHQSMPMLYQSNVTSNSQTIHPLASLKKPQWLNVFDDTADKLLVPPGNYVLVKRFSSKEERRRIVAGIWRSEVPVGFDNKLNYFHVNGSGIDETLAFGLAVWLNSAQVDDYFRVFSGHTQVNAGDLRQLQYPTHAQLQQLAKFDGSPEDAVEYVL